MKQTAVEWFQSQIINIVNGNCELSEIEIFNQAKAMEKEQIKDAWLNAWNDSMLNPLEDKYYEPVAEQYYNETYANSNTPI